MMRGGETKKMTVGQKKSRRDKERGETNGMEERWWQQTGMRIVERRERKRGHEKERDRCRIETGLTS